MKNRIIRREVRYIIEEMNAAYSTFSEHNYMNADYAGFAGMAIGEFRNALRNQTLTREELERMLRDGIQKHRQEGEETDWARFLASHMAQTSNTDRLI